MTDNLHGRIQDLDVTVWVGKDGIDPVVDELVSQLDDHELVKVKFLRAALGEGSVESLASGLAAAANAELVETRGHTAVIR
jgi:RNA-binding protein